MNNVEKYYNSFGLDRSVPRAFIQKQEINNIFAVPEKEKIVTCLNFIILLKIIHTKPIYYFYSARKRTEQRYAQIL